MHSLLLLLLQLLQLHAASSSAPDNGLGSAYTWVPFSDVFEGDEPYGSKPIMFIATKSYCGACKALKPQFAESAELQALSQRFTMVNVADDFAPGSSSANFEPSGGYIPRILFFSAAGEALDIKGPNAQYPHFYSSAPEIAAAMTRVLGEPAAAGAADADGDEDEAAGADDDAAAYGDEDEAADNGAAAADGDEDEAANADYDDYADEL